MQLCNCYICSSEIPSALLLGFIMELNWSASPQTSARKPVVCKYVVNPYCTFNCLVSFVAFQLVLRFV